MLFEFGRIFLEAYNLKHHTDYTPRSFFQEVYWPIFFNHEKLLLYISNSPFVQGLKPGESENRRLERLDTLYDDLINKPLHAGTAPGYPALGETSSTSGQTSTGCVPDGEDEAYLSWIAAGLSVCVEGGCNILFYDADILLRISEGWQAYRDFVNTNKTEGRQMPVWNTYYLLGTEPDALKAGKLPTLAWQHIVFRLADDYPHADQLMGYGYKLGQTNETLGAIPFMLSDARRLTQRYAELFGIDTLAEAKEMFGSKHKLSFMFQRQGLINMLCFEPEGVDDTVKFTEKNKVRVQAYLSWLDMVLGNGYELYLAAQSFAYTLSVITDKKPESSNPVLSAKNRVAFLDAMLPLMKSQHPLKMELYEQMKPIATLSERDFQYMIKMVRVQYARNTPSSK